MCEEHELLQERILVQISLNVQILYKLSELFSVQNLKMHQKIVYVWTNENLNSYE